MDVEEIRAGRTGSEEGLKSVKAVLDQTPLLSPEMLLLARWMKERYFCTLFDAVRVMLPAGLHYQVACSYQAARDIPPEKAGSPWGGGKAADRLSFPVQAPRTQG